MESSVWNSMADSEKKIYQEENEDKGNDRLDFGYRL